MTRSLKLYWHEITAYGISAIALSIGIFYGSRCYLDAISGAGAVVIVCGVLLASSRKLDELHAKLRKFVHGRRADEYAAIEQALTSPQGHKMSEQDVREVYEKAEADAFAFFEEYIEKRKRVFKRHEVLLVVIGTLVNGLGPLVAKWILQLPLR